MFERFTEAARQVVVFAQDEARALGHEWIGTEHLLLGLLREPDRPAARVLRPLGLNLETVRAEVLARVGRGAGPGTGQIPFTPPAKHALELALREALALGDDWIGTGHLLLGLVALGEGVGFEILAAVDLDRVRSLTREELRRGPEPAGTPRPGLPLRAQEWGVVQRAQTLAQKRGDSHGRLDDLRRALEEAGGSGADEPQR